MLRHPDVHLCLAIRLDPAHALEAPDAFLEATRGLLGGTEASVQWIVPAGLFETADRAVVSAIATRTRARIQSGDGLVAEGHHGALHPLLPVQEIEHDLAWAIRNPWKTGILDVLGRAPTSVFPPCPDWSRPGAPELYRKLGYLSVLVGWPRDSDVPYTLRGPTPATGARVLHTLPADPALAGFIRSAVRRGEREIALVVDGPALARGAAAELLSELSRRYHLHTRLFTEVAEPGRVTDFPVSASTLPCSPLVRHAWLSPLGKRKGRGAAASRAILATYAATPPRGPEATPPAGATQPAPRTPDSAMPGDVVLSGNHFDARFDGGVLGQLLPRAGAAVPFRPHLPCLRMGPRTLHATVDSATSFDDGEHRGLRTCFTLGDGPIVVDAWFSTAAGVLVLEILAHYPDTPTATEIVPFGLAVDLGPRRADTPLAEAVLVSVTADGSPHETPLRPPARGARTGTVAGTSHTLRVAGQSVTLSWPRAACRPLPWRVGWRGRVAVVELNPLGTYHPAECAAFAGIRERVTLFLSPGDPIGAIKPAEAKRYRPDLVERA